MIHDLKPYTAMKESGVPWLGKVPQHWSVLRIKSVLREVDARSLDGKGTLLSLTRTRGLIARHDLTDKAHSASTLVGYKRYQSGRLVMNRMQAWSGMFGTATMDGLVSPDYAVFEVLGNHQVDFVLARLKSPDMVGQFALESKGIGSGFNRLYTDRFGPIPITVPPPSEQAAIVKYLNWATGRIDRAITAKKKIIALLNEQKQAIIHQAVTRGLDTNVRMKPSGIPWLGEIPEHWEVRRSKFLFREIDERSKSGRETHLAMSQRLGLVPSSQVQSTLRSETYVGGKVCRPKDLVLNRLKAHLGVFAVADQIGVVSPDYSVFRQTREVEMTYFEHVLKGRGCRGELYQRARGIVEGFWRLYTDDFYDISLPVPPAKEQRSIVEFLSNATDGLMVASEALQKEIALLKEYRTRLVSDVVTGKVDVRTAAAALPDPYVDDIVSESDLASGGGEETVEELDSW